MSACLYIGLGGTGLKILSKIKARLEREGISRPQDVAYLGIDIGAQDIPTNLNQNEILNLSEGAVDEIVKTDVYWNLIEDWWFDRNFAPKFKYTQGAWQLRLLGRLALFYMGNDIIDRVSKVFQNLQGNGVEIFVISSVSGGTGSGLFRDFPGLLKQVANLNNNHNFYGFLINYDIVNTFNTKDSQASERSKHNAVTLFSELDSIVINTNPLILNIRNQNNVAQPIKINSTESYRWIFVQSYNNENGSNLDTVDDYYELASLVLKHSYFISNNNIAGNSWSGIENSIGAMLVSIRNNIRWSLKTKSGKVINYSLPLQCVRQYVGFGGCIIEFPEGEVQEYLVNLLLKDVFEELNNSNVSQTVRQSLLDQILSKIQESQNKDILVNVAESEVVKCAANIGKNIFKATKFQLQDNIKKHLLSSESVETYISTLLSDLNLVLSQLSTSLSSVLDNKYSDCIKTIQQNLVNDPNYNLKQKEILIDLLINNIKFEIEDYSFTEVAWSKKITVDVARSQIFNEINSYNSYINSLSYFQKFFKKEDIKLSKDKLVDNIAKSFVFTYYRTLFLNITNQYILNLYFALINHLQAEKQKIQSELDKFGNYIENVDFYFPDDLQNIITSSSEIDFHIKIAKSRTLVNKYIYQPQKNNAFQQIRINNVINFSSFDNLKNIIENNTRTILQGFTLDKALEIEAHYFLNDLPIVIDTATRKGIIQFDNVIDFSNKATQQEIALFLGKHSIYYDESYLQSVINALRTKVHNKNLLKKCIDDLIQGRLSLIYNRWQSVFNSFVPIPYLSKPQQYVAYKIDNTVNAITTNYFANSFANVGSTLIPSTSKTKLDFVNFKVGFSLMQTSQYLFGLKEQERNRIETNFKYFKQGKFENPDSSKIYHKDKRSLQDIKLLNYSPLISFPITNDKVEDPWKIIILLLSLGYINEEEKKFSRILSDQDGQRICDKNLFFEDFEELYKLIFLLQDDLQTLKDQLEKDVKSKSDKKDILENALSYFKDQSLCPELDQFISEYVDSLC